MTPPSIRSRSGLALSLGVAALAWFAAPAAQAQSLELVGSGSHPHTAMALPLPPPAPRIFAITPERRALLNTIRYAEGTWAGGDDIGYRIMFGGGLMPSLASSRVLLTLPGSTALGTPHNCRIIWRLITCSTMATTM